MGQSELDARIATRVVAMMDGGLVDEVARLTAAGYGPSCPGMTSTGYAQVLEYLHTDVTLGETVEAIRIATRQYARRQRTWFRRQVGEDAVRLDGMSPIASQVQEVVDAWKRAA